MSTERKAHDGETSLARGHEERDITLRPIVIASIGLAVLILIAVAGMRLLFVQLLDREARLSPAPNPLAAAAGPRQPPEPRLLPDPADQLRVLRQEEDTTLETYGWVDRDKGVVRLPIDRAIELVAERGLPALGEPAKPAPAAPPAPEAVMPEAGAQGAEAP